jgi:hypothetical protein
MTESASYAKTTPRRERDDLPSKTRTGAVLIGRNEAQRLGHVVAAACEQAACVVYAVFGRRREEKCTKSFSSRLMHIDWDHPTGEVANFGGDGLIRSEAVRQAGGWSAETINAEDNVVCKAAAFLGVGRYLRDRAVGKAQPSDQPIVYRHQAAAGLQEGKAGPRE